MRSRLGVAALALNSVLALAAPSLLTGCAVSETDVHRWETTERGPEKLLAVVTHDKYSQALRTEAALSLIRMKPRGGRRIGNELVTGALGSIPDDARGKIVAGMTPELLKVITAPRPPKNPDGTWPPDPSIPFKDAAFALLSHEPPLVTDPEVKTQLSTALVTWTQTDFENRLEAPSQLFGLEQMMRFFGPPSVKGLPQLINEESLKIDRVTGLIADIGDAETKNRGSEALVALVKRVESQEWEKKTRSLVDDANKRAKATATEQQLLAQIKQYQEGELQRVFGGMRRLGQRPAVEFALNYAVDRNKPEERRKLALASLEGRLDKGSPADVEKIFTVASADDTPDAVRDLAMARLGELPKNVIQGKLYAQFEGKKWKIRWVSASLLLRTLSTKEIPEFMRRLPATPATKMGMTEPITYGSQIAHIEPQPGDPKPKDAIMPFLSSPSFGAKMTALGFFYGGKKAEQGALRPYEEDKQPVPKCDEPADGCGWTCDVPKAANPKETESRPIATVGDFVRLCVIPSMDQP